MFRDICLDMFKLFIFVWEWVIRYKLDIIVFNYGSLFGFEVVVWF